MIGLNLLPDVKKEHLKAQHSRNMVVGGSILTIFAAIGFTVLLAAFVFGGQKLVIDNLTKQITDNQEILSNKPDVDKYLTVQNQLSALEALHDQKSIYSRVFSYLQKLNPAAPDSMVVTAVAVDKATSMISMQGTTADFKSLDVVQNTLKSAKVVYRQNETDNEKPLFSEVTLVSATLSQSGQNQAPVVTFDFQLAFLPEAFMPTATNIDIVVPKLTPSRNEGDQ